MFMMALMYDAVGAMAAMNEPCDIPTHQVTYTLVRLNMAIAGKWDPL